MVRYNVMRIESWRRPHKVFVVEMGSDVLLSSTIRTRHGEIYQKLRALRTALDEHFRNIQVRMELGDLKRPTSGVYRAPKYVTLLCGSVNCEVATLRSSLNHAHSSRQCTGAEFQQLDRLVADLEMQCKDIDMKMMTRFKERPETPKIQKPPTEKADADGSPSLTLPKLDSPLQLPLTSLQFASPGPPSDCSSSKKGILKRNSSQTREALPKCPPVPVEKPKRVTFNSGVRDSNSKRGFLFRQTSNLGYPYGSCFPSLPPVPTRRRYITENATALKSLPSPLKTLSPPSKKEKTWLY